MPQKPHSKMQSYLVRTLYEAAHPLGYEVWTEQRVRTQRNPARYRVPDLCLTQGEPAESVFTDPPYLCVEILSPDDTAVDLRAEVHEYLAFGVAYVWINVWIMDPSNGTGEIHTPAGIERVQNGRFHAGEVAIQVGR